MESNPLLGLGVLIVFVCFAYAVVTGNTPNEHPVKIHLGEPKADVLKAIKLSPDSVTDENGQERYTFNKWTIRALYFQNGKLSGYENLWSNVQITE